MSKLFKTITLLALFLYFPAKEMNAGGFLGDVAREVGEKTGIKEFKKIGNELDNARRDIKKEIPAIGGIEEAVSRPDRETGKWIENNPKEAVAIFAAVEVGWAACVDGCVFVGNLLVDGATSGGTAGTLVALPLIAFEPSGDPGPETRLEPGYPLYPQAPMEETNQDSSETVSYSPRLDAEYPHKYDKGDYHNSLHNKTPIVTYRSLDDRLGEIFNEFSPPTPNVIVRVPGKTYDTAGGTFLSPRRTSDPKAVAAYGNDVRRIHAATDFIVSPGTPVLSTMTGKVEHIWETSTGFKAVNIRSIDGTLSRVLYVVPESGIRSGVNVKAGETVIGRADNLSRSDTYQNIPNHIHVDFTDNKGRRFDPWSNQVTASIYHN